MKILALDFSFDERSVAVLAAEPDGRALRITEVGEAAGSAGPLRMIEEALRQAQLERAQIEVIAVGLGPGSYTGIRSALALAQGWNLARGVRLVGISSAEAIAAQAQAEGMRGDLAVVIDAQRNEFYLAGFNLKEDGCAPTHPLRLASVAEVRAAEAGGSVLAGPEVTKWFPGSRRVLPRAGTVARLAARRTALSESGPLEPIYLREVSFVKAPPPRRLPD